MNGTGDYVAGRLQRWVRWVSSDRLVRGLWFARCTFARMSGGSDGAGDPDVDIESEETDRAVRQLPDDLRAAVVAFYLGRGTVAQRAKDCGCGERTLYDRIERAKVRLVGIIDEMKTRERGWPVQSCFSKSVDTSAGK